MSDDTALALARYRKRNALQAVDDAITELRVAEAGLAAIEDRDPILIHSPLLGASDHRAGTLAGEASQGASPALIDDALPSPPCASKVAAGTDDGPAADLSLFHAAGPDIIGAHAAAPLAAQPPYCVRCERHHYGHDWCAGRTIDPDLAALAHGNTLA